ncbi:hypothetical protein [Nocardia wallacei]|uniref:hypothetical protein n=1 Tax=Nocardia wallacei TaxID=480035 RepID=UPI0024566630|nr:hypothetical protein [Nocardia wallacei]
MTDDHLLPDAVHLHKAFRGEVDATEAMSILDAAARMIPIQHKRKEAIRRMREPDGLSGDELRRAVGDFTAAEVSLAALATVIDHNVAAVLRGRDHVSGVWHTETVGLVISRMAELWLNYLGSQSHEDAYWVARMSDAYNCLVVELSTGRRLPPDM